MRLCLSIIRSELSTVTAAVSGEACDMKSTAGEAVNADSEQAACPVAGV